MLNANDKENLVTSSLTAAAPFLQGVKVKALEWLDKSIPLMHYHADCDSDGEWRYSISAAKSEGSYTLKRYGIHCGNYPTLKAAKSAAQADYEARVLSAIEPAPSPRAQALEEVAWNKAIEQVVIELETNWPHKTTPEMRDAIRALSSQPVADGWLPIETAPKDGTQILIEIHPGIFDVVCWSGDAWREGGNFMRLRKEPTHWHPLPASPGASE